MIKTEKSFLQYFSSKNALGERKEACLSINGAQSVKLEKGTIGFKTHFKQIPVPLKIYADFECNLKSVENYEGSYSKKYQDHVPYSFPCKNFCVDDKFTKPIVVFRGENAAYEFLKPFNKNIIINEEEEEQFQSSNTCWICEKLIDNGDEKVRDHFHVTVKFRGAAHWSCNMNLQLTKNVPVIFRN